MSCQLVESSDEVLGKDRKPWQLYDLQSDRTETHNLAARFPERVEAMTTAYQAWAQRCGITKPSSQ